MSSEQDLSTISKNQELFTDFVTGVLIYAVVLGFFNDYTEILKTTSYSTTFFVAVVMQSLTVLTLLLKSKVVAKFKGKQGRSSKALMVFFVWLIMFSSKFVFLGAISLIFQDDVDISGFIGLVAIIAVMMIFQESIRFIQRKLA